MSEYRGKLLVIDDEPVALNNLRHVMEKEGYQVTALESGAAAIEALNNEQFDVVLTDLRMKQVDGLQVLRHCRERQPHSEVILITGYASPESAVEAMKEGAFYYVAKPFRLDEVRQVVKEALTKVRLRRENEALKDEIETYRGRVKIITQNETMRQLLDTARQVAPTDCNIILSGESGTGKELLARFIHNHSGRMKGPFLAINCGAFTADLLANELFGHERGAFTGATHLKRGLVEMTSGGTLLLDEITEMPSSMQVTLLRVIQEQEVMRVGGTDTIAVDVRFLASTNRDPRTLVSSGGLRQDLYYRLNVVAFHLPPLRERMDDVLPLAEYFLKKYSALSDKYVTGLSEEVVERLLNYPFPGNVRELENVVERGVALTHGHLIELEHLPDAVRKHTPRGYNKEGTKLASLEEQELAYIQHVLETVGGNKTAAAEILGIDRVSLWRKLKRHGLDEK